MASVCPMTPPAARGKRARFVPNWNSSGILGHHAEREVDGEQSPPEARGVVVVRVAGAERGGLREDDEEGEPHRRLREEVVVGDGGREVDAARADGVHAAHCLAS